MWFSIEYNTGTPIYIQIKNAIKKEILEKRIKSGDSIPSIREFAKKLKVNQNTVAKGLKELEREGILTAMPGIGYKVNGNQEKLKKALSETLQKSLKELMLEYKNIGIKKEEIIEMLNKLWEIAEVENGR